MILSDDGSFNGRVSFLIAWCNNYFLSLLEQVAQGSCGCLRLDVALGSLVCWLATLHIAGGLKLDGHCGPFQPRPFYDAMVYLNGNPAVAQRSSFQYQMYLCKYIGKIPSSHVFNCLFSQLNSEFPCFLSWSSKRVTNLGK